MSNPTIKNKNKARFIDGEIHNIDVDNMIETVLIEGAPKHQKPVKVDKSKIKEEILETEKKILSLAMEQRGRFEKTDRALEHLVFLEPAIEKLEKRGLILNYGKSTGAEASQTYELTPTFREWLCTVSRK